MFKIVKYYSYEKKENCCEKILDKWHKEIIRQFKANKGLTNSAISKNFLAIATKRLLTIATTNDKFYMKGYSCFALEFLRSNLSNTENAYFF